MSRRDIQAMSLVLIDEANERKRQESLARQKGGGR